MSLSEAAAERSSVLENQITDGGQSSGPLRSHLFRRLLSQPLPVAALVYLVLLGLLAVAASRLSPYAPTAQDLANNLQGPSIHHWLGTDELGRDVLSRVIYGDRTSLLSALEAVAIAVALGASLGTVAGYWGGVYDWVVMWMADIIMSVPAIVVAMAILAIFGSGINQAMVALGIVFAPTFLRLMRSSVLEIRQELYIDAARVMGLPTKRILLRHVLPNALGPVVVQVFLTLGLAILVAASLDFLGLGVQPPTPSWGEELAVAAQYVGRQAFIVFPPGVAITLTVLALNLFGDGVRDSIGLPKREFNLLRGRRAAFGLVTDPARGASAARELGATALLEVTDLTVTFPNPRGGQMKVVESVSFTLGRGEIVGLVGESGCGKSMTALALAGLVPPPGRAMGTVVFEGLELLGLSFEKLNQIRGSRIGVVFQNPSTSLNPAFTVGDQLIEPLRQHLHLPKDEARRRAIELLETVRVPQAARRLEQYPHQFSGGMAQRVMIAMALACSPQLLIADEPTTALDVTIQAQILDLIRDLQRELRLTVLFVTHDLGVVADLCDRVLVMYAGQIIESAAADQLFDRPLHPYTEGLLKALPAVEMTGVELKPIRGRVPEPWLWPACCRFATRCEFVTPACIERPIPLVDAGSSRQVRCVRADELVLGGVDG